MIVTQVVRIGPVNGQPQPCMGRVRAWETLVASINIKHEGSDARYIKHSIRSIK